MAFMATRLTVKTSLNCKTTEEDLRRDGSALIIGFIFVASGNTDILKFMLENLEEKKDVNVTDNINATPAHDAAEYGKVKAMLLLLKHGADINITDTVSANV